MRDEQFCLCQVLLEERAALGLGGPASPDIPKEGLHSPEDCADVLRDLHRATAGASPAVALCISGGGIRSATFALGVLQGLAEANVLPRFHYLSTVSGGGYIGSWLSAWVHRVCGEHEERLPAKDVLAEAAQASTEARDQVFEDLGEFGGAAGASLRQEAPPVSFLRDFTSYLSPERGVFSADTWTLVATYLRNLLLNWLLLVPILLALLLLPRLMVPLVTLSPGVGTSAVVVLVGILALSFAMLQMAWQLPSNLQPTERGVEQGRFLRRCLLPFVIAAACLATSFAWSANEVQAIGVRSLLAGTGGFAMLLGTLLSFVLGVPTIRSLVRRALGAQQPPAASVRKAGIGAAGVIAALLAVTALGAGIGSLMGAVIQPVARWEDIHAFPAQYVCVAIPAVLAVFGFSGALLNGLLSVFDRDTDDEDREWWSRAGAWTTIAIVGWLAVSALSLLGPVYVLHLPRLLAGLTGVSGLATLLIGGSGATPAKAESTSKSGIASVVAQHAVSVGAPIFAVLLLATLALGLDRVVPLGAPVSASRLPGQSAAAEQTIAAMNGWQPLVPTVLAELGPSAPDASSLDGRATERDRTHPARRDGYLLLVVLGCTLLTGILSALVIDSDRFSLHAMYRNRLIRAYLGASRNDERVPNPFTGFDPNDNLQLHELARFSDSAHAAAFVQQPLHVLNLALNVTKGTRLAWQQRKAMPFTATPLHCGSHFLGYRDTRTYDRARYGVSIGTALAVSGAAANPNMGYHSSPVVSFLLALFNLRLGLWMQNPGPNGDHANRKGAWLKMSSLRMLSELLGMADASQRFVNLSDGGHFDNLGLYEMVLRRCRVIVVSDAGCDPQHDFEDLASAIHKIRVDLGIGIEFDADDHVPIYSRERVAGAEGGADGAKRFAVARIRYSHTDGTPEDADGWLVYMKPAVYGNEPIDVQNYTARSEAFPHESTVDQFFDEVQFESYRELGWVTARQVIDELSSKPGALADLFGGPDAARSAA